MRYNETRKKASTACEPLRQNIVDVANSEQESSVEVGVVNAFSRPECLSFLRYCCLLEKSVLPCFSKMVACVGVLFNNMAIY